jgi:hypothetical protein
MQKYYEKHEQNVAGMCFFSLALGIIIGFAIMAWTGSQLPDPRTITQETSSK